MKTAGPELITPLLTGRFQELAPFIEVRRVERSVQELQNLIEESVQNVSSLYPSASFDIDIKANVAIVILGEGNNDSSRASAIKLQFPDGVMVRQGKTAEELAARIFAGKSIAICTSGFAVVHQSGQRGITTAGHCADAGQVYSGVNGPAELLFVSERYGVDWDIQWHTTDPYIPTNKVQVGLSFHDITAMKGRIGQAIGDYVCMQGRKSGSKCGYIRTTSFKPTSAHSATFISFAPATAQGGDSGSPIFRSNTAYGILSGSYLLEDENRIYYMAADRIQTGINASILLAP